MGDHIIYKSPAEIELMRESAQLVSKTLGMLAGEIRPGVNPLYLDKLAEEFIRDHRAVPGFLGYNDFPNTLCVSINEEVVHGIPSQRALENGDIISIDCGAILNEFYGDQAYTFEVGEVKEEVKRLLRVTRECLALGIEQVKVGNRLGDVGAAIQQHAETNGYGVVRELIGHGLGRSMHEAPEVPNYGKRGRGKKIQEGLVIAIEPMINMGTRHVKQARDGWTIITADGLPSAHYEHDVAVLNGKAEVLSTFSFVEEALGIV